MQGPLLRPHQAEETEAGNPALKLDNVQGQLLRPHQAEAPIRESRGDRQPARPLQIRTNLPDEAPGAPAENPLDRLGRIQEPQYLAGGLGGDRKMQGSSGGFLSKRGFSPRLEKSQKVKAS